MIGQKYFDTWVDILNSSTWLGSQGELWMFQSDIASSWSEFICRREYIKLQRFAPSSFFWRENGARAASQGCVFIDWWGHIHFFFGGEPAAEVTASPCADARPPLGRPAPSAGVQSSSRGWWPGEKMSDVFLIVSLVHRYPASQGGEMREFFVIFGRKCNNAPLIGLCWTHFIDTANLKVATTQRWLITFTCLQVEHKTGDVCRKMCRLSSQLDTLVGCFCFLTKQSSW